MAAATLVREPERSQKVSAWLAYAREDKEFARRLRGDLTDAGIVVRTAESAINLGDSLEAMIAEEVSQADFFIIILSPNSVNRQWVLSELYYAMAQRSEEGKPVIIPVVTEKGLELPPSISDIVYADFSESYDAGLKHLISSLTRPRIVFVTDETSLRLRFDYLTHQKEQLEVEEIIKAVKLETESHELRSRLAWFLLLLFALNLLVLLIYVIARARGMLVINSNADLIILIFASALAGSLLTFLIGMLPKNLRRPSDEDDIYTGKIETLSQGYMVGSPLKMADPRRVLLEKHTDDSPIRRRKGLSIAKKKKRKQAKGKTPTKKPQAGRGDSQ